MSLGDPARKKGPSRKGHRDMRSSEVGIAAELAAQFHTILACEEDPSLAAVNFDIPAPRLEAYARRVRLYREAATLLAFVERGPDDPKIAPTLAAYQAILMGRADGIVSPGTQRGKEICDALMEIANLVKPGTATDSSGPWVGSAMVFWQRPRCNQPSHLGQFCPRLDGPLLDREVECGRAVARASRGNLTHIQDKNAVSDTELAASIAMQKIKLTLA